MTQKIKILMPELIRIANQMCAYYGGPVYLIGSSMDNETARDIDIRCVISIEDFNRIYGSYSEFASEYISGNFGATTWKWADDRLKRCRDFYKQTGENIDFCVWAEPIWNPEFTHLRLDTRKKLEESLDFK